MGKELLEVLNDEYIIKTGFYTATIKTEKMSILQEEFKRRLEEEGFKQELISKILAIKSEQRKVDRLNVSKSKRVSEEKEHVLRKHQCLASMENGNGKQERPLTR